MAVLYTPEEIQEALKELKIKPLKGLVSTHEAARILSWRALHEHGIDHPYNVSAVRRHVQMGNLTPVEPSSKRFNWYAVGDIFDLPLAPKRGFRRTEESLPEAA